MPVVVSGVAKDAELRAGGTRKIRALAVPRRAEETRRFRPRPRVEQRLLADDKLEVGGYVRNTGKSNE